MAQPVHGLQGAEILAARARQPAERREADEQVERQHRDHDEREVRAAMPPCARNPSATSDAERNVKNIAPRENASL